jgi:hypothetical protein
MIIFLIFSITLSVEGKFVLSTLEGTILYEKRYEVENEEKRLAARQNFKREIDQKFKCNEIYCTNNVNDGVQDTFTHVRQVKTHIIFDNTDFADTARFPNGSYWSINVSDDWIIIYKGDKSDVGTVVRELKIANKVFILADDSVPVSFAEEEIAIIVQYKENNFLLCSGSMHQNFLDLFYYGEALEGGIHRVRRMLWARYERCNEEGDFVFTGWLKGFKEAVDTREVDVQKSIQVQ